MRLQRAKTLVPLVRGPKVPDDYFFSRPVYFSVVGYKFFFLYFSHRPSTTPALFPGVIAAAPLVTENRELGGCTKKNGLAAGAAAKIFSKLFFVTVYK